MDSYLSFSISNEHFALNIRKVIEVLLEYKIIEVPDTPEYILGVINFRDEIVPVVDFRKKFKFKKQDAHAEILIVMEIEKDTKSIMFGALADTVHDVFEVESKHIKPIPEFGSRYNPEYLEGMIQLDKQFFMIIDIAKVFSETEVDILNETKASDNIEIKHRN